MAPGYIPNAFTGFLGAHSLWIDTLFRLDIVGRALGLPHKTMCLTLCEKWMEWEEEREWTLGLVYKMKTDSLFSLKKNNIKDSAGNGKIDAGLVD